MDYLEETMERIRADRIARRSIPNMDKEDNKENNIESNKNNIEGIKDSRGDKKGYNSDIEEITKYASDVDKLLAELKKNEPTSDNQFFRLSIIAYEMGDLHRSIVYAERFKNDPKMRAGHLANGKLALADALTQLYLLCASLHWNFHELRKLGADHLAERHQDFKRDGWSEIK